MWNLLQAKQKTSGPQREDGDAAYLGFSPKQNGTKAKRLPGEHLTTWVWNPERKLQVLLEKHLRDGTRETIICDQEYMKRTTQRLEMKMVVTDIRNSTDRSQRSCIHTVQKTTGELESRSEEIIQNAAQRA